MWNTLIFPDAAMTIMRLPAMNIPAEHTVPITVMLTDIMQNSIPMTV